MVRDLELVAEPIDNVDGPIKSASMMVIVRKTALVAARLSVRRRDTRFDRPRGGRVHCSLRTAC